MHLTEGRNPITRIIAKESANLLDKWRKFREDCPRNERLDLESSEPTLEGVVDLVQSMVKEYQHKRNQGWRGKVVSRFHRVTKTLDAHSALLKVLPEGNEYVSVFTGTINAVIKVCTVSFLWS